MFVQDCIDSSIPYLRPEDEVHYALELMEDNKASILAVVENNILIGTINEKVLLECDDQLTIGALKENFLQHTILEGTHLFDILKRSVEQGAYYLPVVGLENEYIGITSPQKILNTLIQNSSLSSTGGIIMLEIETKNYSLTEISRIVESNGAMILHTMIATSANQNAMQVSLKINKNDLKDIQLAFERYRYSVIAVFHQSEYEVQLKERFDSLMKYLEV